MSEIGVRQMTMERPTSSKLLIGLFLRMCARKKLACCLPDFSWLVNNSDIRKERYGNCHVYHSNGISKVVMPKFINYIHTQNFQRFRNQDISLNNISWIIKAFFDNWETFSFMGIYLLYSYLLIIRALAVILSIRSWTTTTLIPFVSWIFFQVFLKYTPSLAFLH